MTSLILLSEFRKTEIELWKPIEGLDGYEVSSLGRVRSFWEVRGVGARRGFKTVRCRDPKVLALRPHKQGYRRAQFAVNKQNHAVLVHRLVAAAFTPNPLGLRYVNHRTGIKSDNRYDNLEWTTSSDNQRHAYRYGLKPRLTRDVNKHVKIKEDDLPVIVCLRDQWKLTFKAIGDLYNVTDSTAGKVYRAALRQKRLLT